MNASFGASTAAPVLGSVMSPHQKMGTNGTDTAEKPVLTGQSNPPNRETRVKQERFADTVRELNVARLEERPYPVLDAFCQVENAFAGSESREHFVNAYEALISITQEKSNQGPKERHFAQQYLDETPNSKNSVEIKKRILNGSREYLEKKFLAEVRAVIAKHAAEARPGGIPSELNKIRAFIQVKVNKKELGEDTESFQRIGADGYEYPWVILFYLLRAGLTKDAAEYVQVKRNFFQNNDRIFAAAMLHYAEDAERRLSPDLQQKMNHVYQQRARISPTNDAFRMACYKIVGR